MKKLVLAMLLVFGFHLTTYSQDKISRPEVGDILMVNAPNGTYYNHVYFPKLNFLVKRGKIANYKSVHNTMVIVKDVTDKNGNLYITLSPKDGSKFFDYVSKVNANYYKSIASGELSTINSEYNKTKKQGDIALLKIE